MYAEDELLPLSALQHLAFCERQCALIYLEGVWDDNRFTAEGRELHERVHAQPGEWREGVRIARGLRLRSLSLGLIGQADVVEFHACPDGCEVPGWSGRWRPYPVEYKRGKETPDDWDDVQLCAQGVCLEETLGCDVPEGALFYGKTRRRSEVIFTPDLRRTTEALARRLHQLIEGGQTPPATYGRHCRSCSLVHDCLPRSQKAGSAAEYLARLIAEDAGGGEELT